LARFVARFNPRFPFKRYQIGRVFRYEDPQKGRYREFWQCDVDIVGESSPLADAEILNIVIDVFEEFGFKNYTIKVNDRRILREIFEKFLGISDYSTILKIYRIIDKLDKIGKEKVLLLLKELNLGEKLLKQIESFIDASKLSNEEIFRYLESFDSSEIKVAIESLKTILEFSKKKDRIKIDLSLVRGLDYYTGMIYEAVVEEPKIGSLSGGGRYDNLIGIFTGNKIPAVGGSIGVERLIDAGLELGIFKKEKKTYSKVGIVYTKDVDVKRVWEIADYLRNKGINTFVPFESYSGILDGVKDLDKRGVQFALIVGKKEIEEGKLTLQNLLTRERQVVKLEEIDKIVKG
jgi:histidyl-tRNA synthetase